MKFKELYNIIIEAKLPVQSYGTAYNTILSKMKKMKSLYEKLINKVLENEEYIVNDIDAIGLDYYFIEEIKNLRKRQLDNDNSFYISDTLNKSIQTIEHDLSVAKETNDGNFRYKILTEYIPSTLNRFIENQKIDGYNHSLRAIQNSLQEFNSRSVDYGFDEKEVNLGLELQKIVDEIEQQTEQIKVYVDKTQTLTSWNYGEYNKGRDFRPEDLEPIEIAYHASIKAKELFENGFQEEYKGGSLGLGGSSYKGDVSFSLSLDICKTIASSLKEMWMIVHDKWSRESVIEYVRRYTETEENFKDAVDAYLIRRSKSKFPPDNKEDLIEFYLKSLWFIKSPVSKNPVFVNTYGSEWIKKLENIDYNDIGIIKAKIRTENASEFLVAEREIRIPPKDVVEMISIIQ
jgi:uncharacterized protein YukE